MNKKCIQCEDVFTTKYIDKIYCSKSCAQTAHSKRAYYRLKERIFEKFGGICMRCGFSDIRALQVDHIGGGGCSELRGTNRKKYYTSVLFDKSGKYQLLCANCNWIKKHENNEHRWNKK